MKRPTTVEPNSFGGSITLSRRTYAACEYSPGGQYALRSLDTAHSAARGGIANLAVQRWMGLLLQRRPGPAMVVLVILALIGII
jgi:hypothetical protein